MKYKAKVQKIKELDMFLASRIPKSYKNKKSLDALTYIKENDNKTALICAIDEERFDIATEIIKSIGKLKDDDKKIAINKTDKVKQGFSPIHRAVVKNNFEICNKLLDNGATINYTDNRDSVFKSALKQYQSPNYSTDILDLLIKHSADINWKDRDVGDSYLHIAVSNCDLQQVEYLLRNGIDTTLTNNAGKTALALAKEYDDSEKETINSIIRAIVQHNDLKQPVA